MARQVINIGPAPNTKMGDGFRTGGSKINNNFEELYNQDVTHSNSISALNAQLASVNSFNSATSLKLSDLESSIQVIEQDIQTLQSSVTTGMDIANWSNYPALSSLNLNNFNISNAGQINGPESLTPELAGLIKDAPIDSNAYVRVGGEWRPLDGGLF